MGMDCVEGDGALGRFVGGSNVWMELAVDVSMYNANGKNLATQNLPILTINVATMTQRAYCQHDDVDTTRPVGR